MHGLDRLLHTVLCALFPYRDITRPGPDGKPTLYLRRFYIIRRGRFKLFLHNIRLNDPQDPHDHPWDFWSLGVLGSYVEEVFNGTKPIGTRRQRPFGFLRSAAEHTHRVQISSPNTWTLVHTRPARRVWGFYTEDGFQPWNEYLGLKNPKIYEEDRIEEEMVM